MPTDEPRPPRHINAEASRDLARLIELLEIPSPLADPADLTAEQLAAWKPLIERCAFENAQRAEELARLVMAIAEATGAADMLALANWTAGNVSFLLDRPLEALAAFEQAEALYGARRESLQIASLSVGKVSALDKVGRYEDALLCGQAALPILAASSNAADQRRLMSIYNGIGISSEHLGRYAEALEAYEQKWRWWRDRARGRGPDRDCPRAGQHRCGEYPAGPIHRGARGVHSGVSRLDGRPTYRANALTTRHAAP